MRHSEPVVGAAGAWSSALSLAVASFFSTYVEVASRQRISASEGFLPLIVFSSCTRLQHGLALGVQSSWNLVRRFDLG